jgi:uncharacterized protein (TIGR03435 family)
MIVAKTAKVASSMFIMAALFAAEQNTSTPRFDVASVRPVADEVPLGYYGGPGSSDPSRISYSRVTMLTLLREAFGAKRDQITGPAWITEASYAITATLPPKTSDLELRQMHLNLLIERFGMSYHRVSKEDRGYELSVDKGGLKIADSTAHPSNVSAAHVAGGIPETDGRGNTVPGDNWLWQRKVEGSMVLVSFKDASIAALAGALSSWLSGGGAPVSVVDKTGLPGRYTFQLSYENSPTPEPDILAAVRAQLGLRLTAARLLRDHIVIDGLKQLPSEN